MPHERQPTPDNDALLMLPELLSESPAEPLVESPSDLLSELVSESSSGVCVLVRARNSTWTQQWTYVLAILERYTKRFGTLEGYRHIEIKLTR